MDKECPICGSETACEETDIGIGTMYSPAWCNNCGWRRDEEIAKLMKEMGIDE